MQFSDLIQVALLSGIVFFSLGFTSRRFLVRWWRVFQRTLSPRYLKSAGTWSANSLIKKSKEHK